MKFEYRILSKIVVAFLVGWTVFLIFFFNSLRNNLYEQYNKKSAYHSDQIQRITKDFEDQMTKMAGNISGIVFNESLGKEVSSQAEIKTKLDSTWSIFEKQFHSLSMTYYDEEHRFIHSWGGFNQSNQLMPKKKQLQQVLEAGKGTSYHSCADICYFNVSLPIAPYTFNKGIIQLSIPVENIILRFKVLNKPHITFYKRVEKEYSDLTLSDNHYKFQSTSSIVNYDSIKNILHNITTAEHQLVADNKHTYSLFFENLNSDSEILYLIIEDITYAYHSNNKTFIQVILGSLFLLTLLLYLLNILLHKNIKRLQLFSLILPIIGKGEFKSAEKKLNKLESAISLNNPDEIDLLHQSTKVLNEKLQKLHGDLTQQNAQLQVLANYDSMTNVYNRRKFMEAVRQRRKLRIPFALVILDMDHFKLINDTMGHHAGDELLITLSAILKNSIRKQDQVGRMGGDEFAMLIQGQSARDVEPVLDKIINDINYIPTNQESSLAIKVTVSIGVSFYPSDSQNLDELSAFADAAMYENKRNKHHKYNFYTGKETIIKREEELHYWSNLISDSLRNNEISVFFQPLIDNHDHTSIIAYEALARIISKNHHAREANNANFIPYAEQTYAIIQVDRRVMDIAIRKAASISPHPTMMINLSNITIASPRMDQYILECIRKYNFSPENIVIEITESVETTNFNHSNHFIQTLKQAGIRFALDDFGTGFSSYNYISHLKLDFIKIDKAFISGLVKGDKAIKNYRIIESIVFLAKHLDICVVAEGIENLELLNKIKDFDIDLVQGYYFSPPTPSIPTPLLSTHHHSQSYLSNGKH